LAPRIKRYLDDLAQRVAARHPGARVDVMQSSGGIIPAHIAAEQPVRTVLSGPAGGVIGACMVARQSGFDRIIGFDMGGTSTDVFLAESAIGALQLTRESMVAGIPLGVPMLDIHTAGAGGGSIARFDAGGLLRVGPESAGAEPGPICFGRGTLPTVTDANLLLGRLDSESFLGGGVQLDVKRTERMMRDLKGPLATVEEFAAGILEVVEMRMERAIRVISIERGHDPQECTLVAFGGGGPLHACSLARALRIPRVMIPAMPGALSAMGILLADVVRDYSRTVMLPGTAIDCLEPDFAELEQRGAAEFAAENVDGIAQCTADMRYQRQGYELNVIYDKKAPARTIEAFHRLHLQRYGFCDINRPTEIVNLRVRMTSSAEPYSPVPGDTVPGDGISACYAERAVFFDGSFLPTRLYRRHQLVPGDIIPGPAMITEYTSATVVPPGCTVNVDGFRNLIVSIGEEHQ